MSSFYQREHTRITKLAHCFYNFAQFGSVHIVSSFVVTVALAVKKNADRFLLS